MIIDSHAHYAFFKFHKEFRYLYRQEDGYGMANADREQLLALMRKQGIVGFVEPSIGFFEIDAQLALVQSHSAYMWACLGVHPTRCIRTPWKNRKKLIGYAADNRIVAIGETGLDYHNPRPEQHRLRQKRWFVWQIKLAHRLGLPLVLHIREADADALAILKRYKRYLHGGVVHCFTGDSLLAQQYLALGFMLGIGAKLLGDDAQGMALCDTVANVPLTSLVVETDAPFVLPEDLSPLALSDKQKRKLCNTSLILPDVLQKIAEVRGMDVQTVEQTVYENTVRVYGLDAAQIQ